MNQTYIPKSFRLMFLQKQIVCVVRHYEQIFRYITHPLNRAVARSENQGGAVVLDGDNVPPLVEIGLTDLPKTGPPLATALIIMLADGDVGSFDAVLLTY